MRKFYFLAGLATVLFTSLNSTALAQATAPCGVVVEDFQNTSGSTRGFVGTNFVIGQQGQRQYLERNNVVGNVTYTLTTPTYTLPANQSVIGYGFILGGSEKIANIIVRVLYLVNGQITTVTLTGFTPTYSGNSATVCRGVNTNELPGFVAGGSYRFQLDLVPITGDGSAGANFNFDDFRTTGTLAQAALPVSFMGFDARKVSNGVQVTWKVAGEENVNRYEVERSLDGRNFTSVASVATDKKDTYTYLDPSSNSTVYYRIKNVDNDGKYKYSTIARLVNGKSEIVLKAFPQPVLSQLTLQHPVIKGTSVVTVTTADGRLIKTIKPTTGSMQTFVDMSNLKGGMYMVRFDSGDGNVETMKVLKQ